MGTIPPFQDVALLGAELTRNQITSDEARLILTHVVNRIARHHIDAALLFDVPGEPDFDACKYLSDSFGKISKGEHPNYAAALLTCLFDTPIDLYKQWLDAFLRLNLGIDWRSTRGIPSLCIPLAFKSLCFLFVSC